MVGPHRRRIEEEDGWENEETRAGFHGHVDLLAGSWLRRIKREEESSRSIHQVGSVGLCVNRPRWDEAWDQH